MGRSSKPIKKIKKVKNDLIYWLIRAILFVACGLSRKSALKLGTHLGRLAYFIIPKERMKVKAGLHTAFSYAKSPGTLRRLARQVYIDLGKNAMDAMPKGGKIYIRSYLIKLDNLEGAIGNRRDDVFKLGEEVIVVEVEDTGVGIDEHIRRKIFDPFFTTKDRTRGTGLGLSVVSSIMDIHRGSIDVESKKGKGTKFTITFKLSQGG